MMNTSVNVSLWVDYYAPTEQPRFRLFCIPFAGGGASKYALWKKLAPSGIEIVPIQLPGREKRVREPFETDLVSMADNIASAVAQISGDGVPFAVFGHSMGGMLAFETVRMLEENNITAEECIISSTDLDGISGTCSIRDMSNDELLKAISVYGAVKELEALRKMPQYFNMFMRIIRADFIMLENYKLDISRRISVPITALYSDRDRLVSRETMRFWNDMTTADFNMHEFHGDHFFLFDDSEAVLNAIINE